MAKAEIIHLNPRRYQEPSTLRNRTLVVRNDKAAVLEFNSRTRTWRLWTDYDSDMVHGTFLLLKQDGSLHSYTLTPQGTTHFQVAKKPLDK